MYLKKFYLREKRYKYEIKMVQEKNPLIIIELEISCTFPSPDLESIFFLRSSVSFLW